MALLFSLECDSDYPNIQEESDSNESDEGNEIIEVIEYWVSYLQFSVWKHNTLDLAVFIAFSFMQIPQVV